ncbi:unnamed protein product, partial [Iphiclides podalirius]
MGRLVREFSVFTCDTITRIDKNQNVLGVLYIHKGYPELCTLPENVAKTLITKLPIITSGVHRAVTDIDVTNEPVAFRMETNRTEIAVVMDKQFTACVVHKSTRKLKTKEDKSDIL